MNIKIFKDKKHNLYKQIFFKITPTYSTLCPKYIISHFITGNKLYEIMKNNRIGELRWCDCANYIYRYNLYKIPQRPNIIKKYKRIKPNRTIDYRINRSTAIDQTGILILGNLKKRNRKDYISNFMLKKVCKYNKLKGYSHLRRKDLIKLLIKL